MHQRMLALHLEGIDSFAGELEVLAGLGDLVGADRRDPIGRPPRSSLGKGRRMRARQDPGLAMS
jgi:hypothetical protein